jgi:hypothetical protein
MAWEPRYTVTRLSTPTAAGATVRMIATPPNDAPEGCRWSKRAYYYPDEETLEAFTRSANASALASWLHHVEGEGCGAR